jgi:hypothetical protein
MIKPKCDVCGTRDYVELTSYGEALGGLTGVILGSGIFAARGASTGAAISSVLLGLGTAAGGLVGGLAGILAGLITGAKIGEKADRHIIRVYRCAQCGRTIRV